MVYNEDYRKEAMLRNRKLVVHVEKRNEGTEQETADNETFKENADYVLQKLDHVAVKAFFGLCFYVLIDTMRQVQVEKSKH